MILLAVLAPKSEDKEAEEKPAHFVATYKADEFDGELNMQVTGLVVPYREVRIPAQVSGTVTEKSECFQAGSFVKPDDLLVKIDDTDYKIAKTRFELELSQSKTALAELQEEIEGSSRSLALANDSLTLAASELQRKTRLKNAISTNEYQVAERNVIAARREVQTLENNKTKMQTSLSRMENAIKLVEANLEKAQLDIDRCTIRPPSDGVIVAESIEEGEIVSAGTVIARFEDTSRVEVECSLRVDQLNWLLENSGVQGDNLEDAYRLPQTPVEITSSASGSSAVWTGVLSRINGLGLEEMTKTVTCRIDVDNPISKTENGIRPLVRNMYVQVKIKVDQGENDDRSFLTFPATAIQPGSFVWVVKDQKLNRCDVQIVDFQKADDEEQTQMVVVLADEKIQQGDKVVTSPIAQPINGAKVREKSDS